MIASALAMLASACEISTVVGTRDLGGGDVLDESGGPSDDLPSLDTPIGDCELPPPVSCDASSENPLEVVGLDCLDGGIAASGGVFGPDMASAIYTGSLGPYDPREGEKFLILSTGVAAHLWHDHQQLADLFGCDEPEYCPSTDFEAGPAQPPAPITFQPVDQDRTCAEDPTLVGTGDCSNSLFEQWMQCQGGCEVWDASELRISLTVPAHTEGLGFDFAFMSVEWPQFTNSAFNDMFVAWLVSEAWTGNVSFDKQGNPITVYAGFTDYIEDELDGTAMEGHAGTKWLTTIFGVEPGESVQLVLAVFDMTDGAGDSVVLLDGVRFTCAGPTPTTDPVP
jgi:hypothetical protein